MMERRQIVELWGRGRAGVLVTLVRIQGSSYRRPGARLLTSGAAGKSQNGAGGDRTQDDFDIPGSTLRPSNLGHPEYAGTISGGCLEADVVRRAAWMVRDGAAVERYSMEFDDTAEVPFGLGCGGTVELLLEPVETAEGEVLLRAMAESLEGTESRVVSFLPGGGRGLRRLVVDAAGEVVFASQGLSAEKIACAMRLTPGEEYEGRFVERMEAPQRLIVLGAGDDARPVARLGSMMGWTVMVADGRAQLARKERFPEAAVVRTVRSAEELGIGRQDAVVLMTHSYEQDRMLLAGALALEPRYLGLLGSRHRSSLLVTEAAETLGWSVERCCERLFAPVGMDLGGDGPEAIALSIVSEVQALANGRLGHSLRLTAEGVAEQVEKGGASRYMAVECALEGL